MLRRVVLAAVLGVLAWMGPGQAQSSDPSFRIVNNTPNVVNEVYASPSNERSWGQDRLGNEVIAPGASWIVRLPSDGNCNFDVRIVYQGGTAEERRNLNTCNMTDLVLGQPSGPAPRTAPRNQPGSTQQGNPSFNLVNQSGRVIEELYASPSSQQNWGPDRLGEDVVQPGATYPVRLPQGECTYDLRIVFSGGQAQERRNVNACAVTNYTVR
ncbi:hypothetical protein [Belnapia rosea]|uniref:Secreted protein n=1 Tax=Belnapia rosea TaxID=938405 RepID=A0A1G6Y4S7_9PROT|nr:hypothetical protein [Belnapia rosea]SDB72751.1 hypothetical protein SAMN02927895_04526 [Belnapia rosea]SDD84576.1 hypothetical protein SAMN04487779_101378 [Belnapia rosea]